MAVKSVYPSNGSNRRKKSVASAKKSVKATYKYKNTRRPKGTKSQRSFNLRDFFQNIFRQRPGMGEIDYTFLLLVAVLTIFGLIMLLSASTPTASVKFKNSYYFFNRQLFFVGLGFVFMFIFANIDYKRYKPFVNLFYLICVVLLVCVFIPGLGVERNGSRRWVDLKFMDFQPSEMAKLAVAMFYASMIEQKRYNLKNPKELAFASAWIGIIAVLMLCETHLSGTIVICSIAFCLMLIGGANLKVIGVSGAAVGVLGYMLLQHDEVRWARVVSFLHPFSDAKKTGYQTIQSLYAIGSGGIFGKGLGQSVQKFSYLPEPYNDFIFSIVCEELGLLGAGFIIVLFGFLIMRGLKIAMEAPDKFAFLTVVGIMTQLAVQTVLNIAVATSSIPNTGVSLPFFSYGGTAVMILLAEMGIVLGISRYSTKNIS